MTERVGWIYCLLEPNENVIRYVGQTRRHGGVPARLDQHVKNSRIRLKENAHLQLWLRSLDKDGMKPRFEVLTECGISDLDICEIYWIAYMRSIGCDLVNSTIGGTGGATRTGMKTPRETAMKQGAAWIGRKHRLESLQKITATRAADRAVPRSCIVCHKVFYGYLALRNHVLVHGEQRTTVGCMTCGKEYVSLRNFRSHAKKLHDTPLLFQSSMVQ